MIISTTSFHLKIYYQPKQILKKALFIIFLRIKNIGV